MCLAAWRHAVPVLLHVGLVGGLAAQSQSHPVPLPYSTSTIPWPVASGSQIRRIAVGDFLSQRRRHVVALDGNRAYALFSPATMTSAFALPASWVVNDLAVLNSGLSDERDLLVGVGAGGLTVASVTDTWGLDVVAGPAGRWTTATRIKASGSLQSGMIVGLADNNYTLLVATCAGGAVTTTASLALGRSIVDFELVDWDGDQLDEIAVLGNGGLRVYNALLQQQGAAFPGPVAGSAIVTLHASGAERVAWVRPEAGNYEISVIGAAATEPTVTITGVTSFGGVAAGDATGDRRPELMIAMPNSGEVMLLAHLVQANATSPSFANLAADKAVLDVSPSGLQPLSCVPGLFDVDFDLDADIVAASGAPTELAVAVGIGHTLRAFAPSLPMIGAPLVFSDDSGTGGIGAETHVWVQVNRPQGFENYKWVDVQLWRETEGSSTLPQGPGLGIESISVGHWQFDISAVTGLPWIGIQVAGSSQLDTTSNLWGEVRFFDPVIGVKATSPTTVCGGQRRDPPYLDPWTFSQEFPYFANTAIFPAASYSSIKVGPIATAGRTVLGGLILPKKLPPVRVPTLPPQPIPPLTGPTISQPQ